MQTINIDCGEQLLIADCANFISLLPEQYDTNSAYRIDAQLCRDIDTAGLQLLYSLVKTLDEHACKWCWHKPSQSLKENAAIIAIDEALQFGKVNLE